MTVVDMTVFARKNIQKVTLVQHCDTLRIIVVIHFLSGELRISIDDIENLITKMITIECESKTRIPYNISKLLPCIKQAASYTAIRDMQRDIARRIRI